MAPSNTKTYGRKDSSVLSKNFSRIIPTIKKKIKQKLIIPQLPKGRIKQLSQDSIEVELDDTFDKVQKGEVFNNVKFIKNMHFQNVSSENDLSMTTNSALSIRVNDILHSPIIFRPKTRNKRNIKTYTTNKVTSKKETTLDRSVNESLYVEKVQNLQNNSSSIHLSSFLQRSKERSELNNEMKEKSLISEESVLKVSNNKKFLLPGCSGVAASTPVVSVPSKKILNDNSISPISRKSAAKVKEITNYHFKDITTPRKSSGRLTPRCLIAKHFDKSEIQGKSIENIDSEHQTCGADIIESSQINIKRPERKIKHYSKSRQTVNRPSEINNEFFIAPTKRNASQEQPLPFMHGVHIDLCNSSMASTALSMEDIQSNMCINRSISKSNDKSWHETHDSFFGFEKAIECPSSQERQSYSKMSHKENKFLPNSQGEEEDISTIEISSAIQSNMCEKSSFDVTGEYKVFTSKSEQFYNDSALSEENCHMDFEEGKPLKTLENSSKLFVDNSTEYNISKSHQSSLNVSNERDSKTDVDISSDDVKNISKLELLPKVNITQLDISKILCTNAKNMTADNDTKMDITLPSNIVTDMSLLQLSPKVNVTQLDISKMLHMDSKYEYIPKNLSPKVRVESVDLKMMDLKSQINKENLCVSKLYLSPKVHIENLDLKTLVLKSVNKPVGASKNKSPQKVYFTRSNLKAMKSTHLPAKSKKNSSIKSKKKPTKKICNASNDEMVNVSNVIMLRNRIVSNDELIAPDDKTNLDNEIFKIETPIRVGTRRKTSAKSDNVENLDLTSEDKENSENKNKDELVNLNNKKSNFITLRNRIVYNPQESLNNEILEIETPIRVDTRKKTITKCDSIDDYLELTAEDKEDSEDCDSVVAEKTYGGVPECSVHLVTEDKLQADQLFSATTKESLETSHQIESVASNNVLDECYDKINLLPSLPKRRTTSVGDVSLTLRPGKWRRSLSLFRRSIIAIKEELSGVSTIEEDLEPCVHNMEPCTQDQGGVCACAKCRKSPRQTTSSTSFKSPSHSSHKRLSTRIIPLGPLELPGRQKSLLHTYAASKVAGYATRHTTLEDIVQDLSLEQTSLHVKSLPSSELTAKDIVFQRCGQSEALPFSTVYNDSILKNGKKIGEGVYGEVFLLHRENKESTVVKVIPIEGKQLVNGERQKKFEEILSEIVIALELSNLRNGRMNGTSSFSELLKLSCVKGKYPNKLLEMWDQYDDDCGSENDSPRIFKVDQLYMCLEFANAGKDMEAFVFNNAQQAYSVFRQIVCALAVAEAALQFEHRDMHWGNILIQTVDKTKVISYNINGYKIDIPSHGVKVTIIDFTMSRITCEGVCIYNDLADDPELFTADGDYQFEIYKLMQQHTGNSWQQFSPYTNILWMHYILNKLITALRYKYILSKLHRDYIHKLKGEYRHILKFKSIYSYVEERYLTVNKLVTMSDIVHK